MEKNAERPLILVTNDDGVMAPGIAALIQVAAQLGDVIVVAPDKPQSGMGHAITINSTLRINHHKIDLPAEVYSTSGTPVDCVKLAIKKILPRKPDLVLSGINHGSNSSINVIYSGTMSAAIEGCLEGLPSIGFSLCDYSIEADFTMAQHFALKIAKQVLENGLPNGVCLNVNFPKIAIEECKGTMVCRQATANYEEEFDERTDPHGRKYYWLTGVFKNYDNGTDTDEWALANNFVSIVPIQYDLTAHHTIAQLNTWKF